MITIGIDPHKRSLTAVALDPSGAELGQMRLAVSSTLGHQLLAWAQAWPTRRWAIEGATGLGRGIAQVLAAADEFVLDVPAKLAARARLLGSGSSRKTDVTTRLPWRRSASATSDSVSWSLRITPWCCACCPTGGTTSSPSALVS